MVCVSCAGALIAVLSKMLGGQKPEQNRARDGGYRSEEHTSELQSHLNLVCRLLLEKKKENVHLLGCCSDLVLLSSRKILDSRRAGRNTTLLPASDLHPHSIDQPTRLTARDHCQPPT